MAPSKAINIEKDRILVIGAAGLDIVGRMNALPDPGASTSAIVRPSFGGVARNVAENLARLGQPVHLITAVGKDDFGQQLLDHTAAAGVNVTACLKSSEFSTASYLAVLNSNGRLQFALDDMRIASTLTPEYIEEKSNLFFESGLVFVDANLSQKSLDKVIELADQAQIPVCADATSKQLALRLLPILDKIYLLTANTLEAALICGRDIEANNEQDVLKAARKLINKGAEISVIPMAEFGVCYANSETSGQIPAIHTAISDPTGAGDALTAAVIFGLMNDISLDESVRLGVSAASLTLRTPGTVIPNLSLELLYDHLVI